MICVNTLTHSPSRYETRYIYIYARTKREDKGQLFSTEKAQVSMYGCDSKVSYITRHTFAKSTRLCSAFTPRYASPSVELAPAAFPIRLLAVSTFSAFQEIDPGRVTCARN